MHENRAYSALFSYAAVASNQRTYIIRLAHYCSAFERRMSSYRLWQQMHFRTVHFPCSAPPLLLASLSCCITFVAASTLNHSPSWYSNKWNNNNIVRRWRWWTMISSLHEAVKSVVNKGRATCKMRKNRQRIAEIRHSEIQSHYLSLSATLYILFLTLQIFCWSLFTITKCRYLLFAHVCLISSVFQHVFHISHFIEFRLRNRQNADLT